MTDTPFATFAVPLPEPGRAVLARRAAQVAASALRHFGIVAWRRRRDEVVDQAALAHALRLMFEDLGATWMKFGQLVGSAPGVFGDDMSGEFRSCLDTGPALPFEVTRAVVELDLRNEMRAMAHYCRLLDQVDLPFIVVPEPVPDLSGRTVLTMEYLDGVATDDLAAIEALGHDPRPRLEQLLDAWFITALSNGVFHGDVHAGNLLVLRDGRLGVLDWGIVGRLDESTHRFFRRMIEAVLGDPDAWDDIADHIVAVYGDQAQTALGLAPGGFRDFVRSQLEPLLSQPFGEVSLAMIVQDPSVAARAQQAASTNGSSATGAREVLSRWRQTRRRRQASVARAAIGSSFDRGMFLLGKQLLYFERYGRMFLADRPIVADRDFFARILAEDPLDV